MVPLIFICMHSVVYLALCVSRKRIWIKYVCARLKRTCNIYKSKNINNTQTENYGEELQKSRRSHGFELTTKLTFISFPLYYFWHFAIVWRISPSVCCVCMCVVWTFSSTIYRNCTKGDKRKKKKNATNSSTNSCRMVLRKSRHVE